MATIRRRGKKFQVQVRRQGYSPVSKSFSLYVDAKIWARDTERSLDRGCTVQNELSQATLEDILIRYRAEVTVHKKGRVVEERRIKRLLSDPLTKLRAQALTSTEIARFRDKRLKDGQRACAYDLVIIRHALEIARKEWGLILPQNPADNVRKPPPCKPRRRRVNTGEYEALCEAVKSCRVTYLWPLINLAIETAMRRGELLKLSWTDIDWEDQTATLSDTKNGLERVVPLSDTAIAILEKLKRPKGKVFQATEVAVRQAWERLVARAGITDLHFHDLRHEAISRFFEMGLSVPEVALISGHKDYRMLARYTHLRAEDVGKKMERLQAQAHADL